MKTGLALSIQQPWAWLIANGFKDIENRDWPTKVRGVFGIHAGKKIDTAAIAYIRRAFPDIALPETFETGGIVGRAVITGCVTEHTSRWFTGKYGFVLAEQRPMPLIPCRGMLGFFRPAIAATGASR